MGALRKNYYELLEKEAQGIYEYNDYSKKNSLYEKSIAQLSKIAGLNPAIAKLLLVGGGRMGAASGFDKKIASVAGIGDGAAGAALMTPYLLNSMQRMSDTNQIRKEANYYNGAGNFQDYGASKQMQHALRVANKGLLTAGGIGAMGALAAGKGAAAGTMLTALNPSLLLGKGAAAIGMASGGWAAAIPALLASGVLSSKLFNGKLNPKSNKITIPQPRIPGAADLLSASTYRRHAQMLQIMQNQGLLQPGDIVLASILNDINLNTSALIPMYSKMLGNSKDVNVANTSNDLISLFESGDRFSAKFDEDGNRLNKNDLNNRKAFYNLMQSAELGTTDLLYKVAAPLMYMVTGKKYSEFAAEKWDIENIGQGSKLEAKDRAAKKLNVSTNLFMAADTSADQWLGAPDYESKMLGLIGNMHEILRAGTLSLFDIRAGIAGGGSGELGKYSSAFNLSTYIEDELNRKKDPLEEKGFVDNYLGAPGKALIGSLRFLPRLYNTVKKINTGQDTSEKIANGTLGKFFGIEEVTSLKSYNLPEIRNPIKALKEGFQNKIKKSLGIRSRDEIQEEFYKQLTSAKHIDSKASMEKYMGEVFPNDMQLVLHELKQQTTYLADLLNCQGCKASKLEMTSKKWRGNFGDFMEEEDYQKKLFQKAARGTKKSLGMLKKSFGGYLGQDGWLMGKLAKAAGIEMNEDKDGILHAETEDFGILNEFKNKWKNRVKKKTGKEPGVIDAEIIEPRSSVDKRQNKLIIQREEEARFNALFQIRDFTKEIRDFIQCQNEAYGVKCTNGHFAGKLGALAGLHNEVEPEEDDGDMFFGGGGGDSDYESCRERCRKKRSKRAMRSCLKKCRMSSKNKNPKGKKPWYKKLFGKVKGFGGKLLGGALTLGSLIGIPSIDLFDSKTTGPTVDDKKPKKTSVKPEPYTTKKANTPKVKKGFWARVWNIFMKKAKKSFGGKILRILGKLAGKLLGAVASGPLAVVMILWGVWDLMSISWDIANMLWSSYKLAKSAPEVDETVAANIQKEVDQSTPSITQILKDPNAKRVARGRFNKDLYNTDSSRLYQVMQHYDFEDIKAQYSKVKKLSTSHESAQYKSLMEIEQLMQKNKDFKQQFESLSQEEFQKKFELYQKDKDKFMEEFGLTMKQKSDEQTQVMVQNAQLTAQVVLNIQNLTGMIGKLNENMNREINVMSQMLGQLIQLNKLEINTVKDAI